MMIMIFYISYNYNISTYSVSHLVRPHHGAFTFSLQNFSKKLSNTANGKITTISKKLTVTCIPCSM